MSPDNIWGMSMWVRSRTGSGNRSARGDRDSGGFTLIELLVVIAILGILIGILFIPLLRSFGFLASEESQIQLQNITKEAMRQVVGEIAEAMQVLTFTGNPTRIDLVLPASAILNRAPGNAPGSTAGRGPGQMRETFFVGLADPTKPYNNPIAQQTSSGVASGGASAENEYVLWRAIYNLNDPTDPVTKALTSGGTVDPTLLNNPWFFDDSLKTVITGVSQASPMNDASNASLLVAMRNHTARLSYLDSSSNVQFVAVAAGLTPVVTSGHLDAVRSRWDSTGNAWFINPRIRFVPGASQNEILTSSEFGTQFQSSRGQWVTPGSSSFSAQAFWGTNFAPLYSGITQLGGSTAPITVLNGANAGTIYSSDSQGPPPFFVDPRTGRITFTQFQVTETIPVAAGQNVYPLFFPNDLAPNTYAQLVNPDGSSSIKVRAQVIPYSESVQLVPANVPYSRLVGNVIATNPTINNDAATAYQVAAGLYPVGPGSYAINYVASLDLANGPPSSQPYIQTSNGYTLGDEVPLIELPQPGSDPLLTPGSQIQVTYRFTFATLGADGKSMVEAAATYASQRLIHATLAFRKYDETNRQPYDYSLSTSVGSANPIDERPASE